MGVKKIIKNQTNCLPDPRPSESRFTRMAKIHYNIDGKKVKKKGLLRKFLDNLDQIEKLPVH